MMAVIFAHITPFWVLLCCTTLWWTDINITYCVKTPTTFTFTWSDAQGRPHWIVQSEYTHTHTLQKNLDFVCVILIITWFLFVMICKILWFSEISKKNREIATKAQYYVSIFSSEVELPLSFSLCKQQKHFQWPLPHSILR